MFGFEVLTKDSNSMAQRDRFQDQIRISSGSLRAPAVASVVGIVLQAGYRKGLKSPTNQCGLSFEKAHRSRS
jgi:hypothetical protein